MKESKVPRWKPAQIKPHTNTNILKQMKNKRTEARIQINPNDTNTEPDSKTKTKKKTLLKQLNLSKYTQIPKNIYCFSKNQKSPWLTKA